MALSDHPAYRLVIDHARALGSEIAIKVRAELEQMDEPLLSGDDSGLTSVWLEICAQVQGEESFFGEQYREMVVDMIDGRVQGRSTTEKQMLWLATEPGWDWLWDVVNAGEDPAPEHPGIDTGSVAEWIWSDMLLPIAESDMDPRVERFLEGGHEEWPHDDKDDLDDEVEEQEEMREGDEDEEA